MLSIISKLAFLFKKPKIIIVSGRGKNLTTQAICQTLGSFFKLRKISNLPRFFNFNNEILIFETEKGNKNFKFLIKNSSFPILVVTHIGDIPPDKDFFAGERENVKEIRELAKTLPARGCLILNFDDETSREIKDETELKELTFGFQEWADFRATDINLDRGTNFKINYKGNAVPVWLDKLFGKEQVYSALAAAAVGTVLGLNLVEISQSFKSYHGLPGKMKLIEGIKHSWVLDDSESATIFSMAEAVKILGEIKKFNRKIAVLGDVIGVGKYTIEAHEAIGERVAKAADLLFTFGPRAKFIAKGAESRGMPLEKIFSFDTIAEGKLKLQEEIKEGDLILVDGSKEMEMQKIVKEIKKM